MNDGEEQPEVDLTNNNRNKSLSVSFLHGRYKLPVQILCICFLGRGKHKTSDTHAYEMPSFELSVCL